MRLSRFAFLLLLVAPLAAQVVASDPVTGVPDTLLEPALRTAQIARLDAVQQNFNLTQPGSTPFALSLSFNAAPGTSFSGNGTLVLDWGGDAQHTTWTTALGDTTLHQWGNMFLGAAAPQTPVRVAMLHAALFWPMSYGKNLESVSLRKFETTYEGTAVTCLLLGGPAFRPPAQGRGNQEWEYCLDKASGLLRVWSPAPGVYAAYDYGNAHTFVGHTLPGAITWTAGGQAVETIQIAAFGPLATLPQRPAVTPATPMVSMGRMSGPYTRWRSLPMPPGVAYTTPQAVVLHLALDNTGAVVERETVGAPDSALLAIAAQWLPAEIKALAQAHNLVFNPKAAPQVYNVYIGFGFTPPPAGAAAQPMPTPPVITATPLAAGAHPSHPPYVVTVVTDRVQTLPDGNVIENVTRQRIARDSAGDSYNEQLGSENRPVLERIYSISAHNNGSYQVFPERQFAIHQLQSAMTAPIVKMPPPPARAANPNTLPTPLQTEQLGQQTIDGLLCDGVRTTRVIPAGQIGNRDPITTVTETWRSPQFPDRPIRQVTTDPRNGVITTELQDLQIGEPPADLFTVPAGFKVMDQSMQIVTQPDPGNGG